MRLGIVLDNSISGQFTTEVPLRTIAALPLQPQHVRRNSAMQNCLLQHQSPMIGEFDIEFIYYGAQSEIFFHLPFLSFYPDGPVEITNRHLSRDRS